MFLEGAYTGIPGLQEGEAGGRPGQGGLVRMSGGFLVYKQVKLAAGVGKEDSLRREGS